MALVKPMKTERTHEENQERLVHCQCHAQTAQLNFLVHISLPHEETIAVSKPESSLPDVRQKYTNDERDDLYE